MHPHASKAAQQGSGEAQELHCTAAEQTRLSEGSLQAAGAPLLPVYRLLNHLEYL